MTRFGTYKIAKPPQTNNIEGKGASDIQTPAAKSLYKSIFLDDEILLLVSIHGSPPPRFRNPHSIKALGYLRKIIQYYTVYSRHITFLEKEQQRPVRTSTAWPAFICMWADPYRSRCRNQSFGSGPDPAFQVNPDPGFWWPKIEKIYNWNFLKYFLIKNINLLIPRPP